MQMPPILEMILYDLAQDDPSTCGSQNIAPSAVLQFTSLTSFKLQMAAEIRMLRLDTTSNGLPGCHIDWLQQKI